MDENPKLAKIIPDLPNNIYTTKAILPSSSDSEGAIVYVRTGDDTDMLSWIDTKGNIITQSQAAILKAAFCTDKTKAIARLSNYHELVRKGIIVAHEEEKKLGGALGKRSSIKYQVYMRLERYCKENERTLLLSDSFKKSVDDIYKNPLTESAKDTLSRQLKAGANDPQIADLVVTLREEGKLVISGVDTEKDWIPQIICSLGLKKI